MNQVKRKLSSDQSPEKKVKKLRNEFDRSITCIENLTNELFYEIFDYLDGCEICEAFSNLNHRFQQLLNSSSLLFKIKLDHSTSEEVFVKNYHQLILLNKHKIYSIHLWTSENFNLIISSFTIDSSFNRLQSLVLDDIGPDVLNSLLINLTCLPRFFSLSINTWYSLIELSEVYRLIFALPKLRRMAFLTEVFDDFETTVSLPIATYQQFSTINYLYISHSCTFNELFAIISYTPQLSRLEFVYTNGNNANIETILPITLSNLTYMSIDTSFIEFDEFEMFITKIYSKLKVLCLTTEFEDMSYIDANRWEELILQYLPQLKKFHFRCYEQIDDEYESPINFGKPNQFTSSFWLEQQWVFEVAINSEHIWYSILPYRKRWYEYTQNKVINSSIQLSKSMRLILMSALSEENIHLLRVNINRILSLAQIYHLEIQNEIFIGTLNEFFFSFLELDSLKIHSLSLSQPSCLSIEEATLHLVSIKNKITKVCLEKMIEIDEIYCLIELCPRMIYLQIDCINNMDSELFLRDILTKINNDCNQYFRSLCFRVPTAEDNMIKKLEKMVNSEKLLLNYSIKRILDNIYLQWE